jgi:lipid-A-disaccharide synthase
VSELKRLALPFIQAAAWCRERRADIRFVAPMANERCRVIFEDMLARQGGRLPVTVLNGRALEAMAAADVVLLASGTATLECMLLKRPMVVAYRLSPLTYRLARLLVKTKYYSLPNLLADDALVPELIQDEVSPESLGREIMQLLENPARAGELAAVFARIHTDLRRGASAAAAEVVLQRTGRA